MKMLIYSTLLTSIIFLVVDLIWLSYAVKSFYKPHLGSLLNEKPIMWGCSFVLSSLCTWISNNNFTTSN